MKIQKQVLVLVSLLSLSFGATVFAAQPKVFFKAPKNNAEVGQTFTVKFGEKV